MLPVREYVRETGADQDALAKGQLEVRYLSLPPLLYDAISLNFGIDRASNYVHSDYQISWKGQRRYLSLQVRIDQGLMKLLVTRHDI